MLSVTLCSEVPFHELFKKFKQTPFLFIFFVSFFPQKLFKMQFYSRKLASNPFNFNSKKNSRENATEIQFVSLWGSILMLNSRLPCFWGQVANTHIITKSQIILSRKGTHREHQSPAPAPVQHSPKNQGAHFRHMVCSSHRPSKLTHSYSSPGLFRLDSFSLFHSTQSHKSIMLKWNYYLPLSLKLCICVCVYV